MEQEYLLTIKIPFNQIDDVGARMQVSEIKKNILLWASQNESEIKLQRLRKGQTPEKVQL